MLPEDSTPRSKVLLALAQDMLQHCPQSLYEEAAVTGSVSRGVADDFSDIELNFWTDQVQPIDTYRHWIESFDINAEECRPAWHQDGQACHLEYTIYGVKYDLIWQRWHDLDLSLAPLKHTKLPSDPTFPWMVFHAVPIGDAPRLSAYQALVASYPESLKIAIIEQHLSIWRRMMRVPSIFFAQAQAQRGQIHDLRRRQLMSIDSILIMLFAYNQLWQPDFKWLKEESKRLTHKPPQLVARVHAILNTTDATETARKMIQLKHDTLTILASDFDVDDLISRLQQQ